MGSQKKKMSPGAGVSSWLLLWTQSSQNQTQAQTIVGSRQMLKYLSLLAFFCMLGFVGLGH